MMADGAGRARVQKYQLILPDILDELKRHLKLSTSGTTENLLNTDRQLEEILEDPQLTTEMKRMLYSDTLRRRRTFQDLERQKQAAYPQQQNQLLAQLPLVQLHAPPSEQRAAPLLTSTPSPLLSQRSAAPMSMASAGPSSAKPREVWSRVSFHDLAKPPSISPTLGSFGEVPFAPRKSDPLNRMQQHQVSPTRFQNVPTMASARLLPEVTGEDDDESREGDLFQSPVAHSGGPFEQILSSVSPQFRGNVKNTLDALSQIPQDQFAIDPSTMEVILQGRAIPASHIIDVLKVMNAPSVNENRLPPGTRETAHWHNRLVYLDPP